MYVTRLIFFLILNFAGLGIGAVFTEPGVQSGWYLNLYKAPWTPAGWMFFAAWTVIMICFSFYMADLFRDGVNTKRVVIIYLAGWMLNISWNIIFFRLHKTGPAFIVILLLLADILFFFAYSARRKKLRQILLLSPYIIWLTIAISLNEYIVTHN